MRSNYLDQSVLRVLAAVLVLAALVSCAPRIQANVSAFSALSASDTGKTFRVAARTDEDAASLEWQSYAAMVETRLAAKGFRPVRTGEARPGPEGGMHAPADVIAYLSFSIDAGEQVVTAISGPHFGLGAFAGGPYWGRYPRHRHFGAFGAVSAWLPVPGFYGYPTRTRVSTVYTRQIAIDLVDAATGDQLWEMKLMSRGSCGRFSSVAPVLLDAALQSFPAAGGGEVTLDWVGNC